jgi:hypothetical protein
MSTQPNDIDPNPAPNADPQPDPAPQPDPQPNPDPEPESPYADLAKEMGWVPKDQFNGSPEDWKDPETFIRAGRDIQRDTTAQLRAVRAELETLTRTSASIVEQQVKDRVAELTDRYNKAVEDGKPQEAFDLAREITTINTQPATAKPQASPEAQAFAERNSSWFQKPGNEYATARAIEICNTLAAQGYKDHGTQLRIAEQRMKQEMPQLFSGNVNGTRKDPPGVNAPNNRSASPSNRQKGFADMPKEAQDIARDMVERKVINSTDDYVRNYFANIAGKA